MNESYRYSLIELKQTINGTLYTVVRGVSDLELASLQMDPARWLEYTARIMETHMLEYSGGLMRNRTWTVRKGVA